MNEQSQSPDQLAAAIVGHLRDAQRLTAQLRAMRKNAPRKNEPWRFGGVIDHTAPVASHISEAIASLQSIFGGRL